MIAALDDQLLGILVALLHITPVDELITGCSK